jgi:excinuclease ABC subunit C
LGRKLIEEWLGGEEKKKVRILAPSRGQKRQLLNLARENARNYLAPRRKGEEEAGELLAAMRERLRLGRIPRRIEAFDISDIGGLHAVGSLVVFQDGKPDKERYRHFRIRTVTGPDDYGMMREVLLRRYQKARDEEDLPDLVLVDGGRGQLNVAREVLQQLRIRGVDLLSLAKERNGEAAGLSQNEKIFHPGLPAPIILEKDSPLLNLLDHIRDEAHRFAITYHKKIRTRGAIQSMLEGVPGIGATRRRELLEYFGTVGKIAAASLGELSRVPKMNQTAARATYQFFHPPER